MKQYNPHRFIGAYWTQLQYSASYITFINFSMIAANLWIASQAQLTKYVPWLTFPIFATAALVVLFVVLPYLDYVFMLKSRIRYQNEQICRHDNPVMAELDEIKHNLKKHMGKDYETITNH